MSTRNTPLASYTVLDLTIARAGPVAVRLFADWGAEVIRVEPLPTHDRGSVTGRRREADEQNLHRGKRSICLDLKTPAGQEILQRLVKKSDVVIENFRPDVKERLGVSYEQLEAIKPGIILASISGFGQEGPYAHRPAVDQVIQGMSGLSSITGHPGGGPVRTGIAIADTTAGMFLAQGILIALLHKERTGEGQWVHTSLLEGMISKLDFQAARYTVSKHVPQQVGNSHPTASAMNTYQAKDGPVNISASTERMWKALCTVLNAEHLLSEPDFVGLPARLKNRAKLDVAIAEVTKNFTVADLVQKLNGVGVPCGPIYNMAEVFADPQMEYLRMTRPAHHAKLGTIDLVRSPLNFSAFPHADSFARAAPDAGEHSDAILSELGFTPEAVEALRAEGAII